MKEAKKEREEWAKSLTIDDVIFNEDMTNIVSIKGLPIKEFKDKMLVVFCRANNVKIASGKSSKMNRLLQK